jgi:hypothetical protein
MTLKPTDMLEIQSAIDEYERKFPRRPAPSAEVALAWRLGKKEWAKRQAAANAPQAGPSAEDAPEDFPAPWIKNALMVGWWGMVAVMVASVFVFGAIVGGFK